MDNDLFKVYSLPVFMHAAVGCVTITGEIITVKDLCLRWKGVDKEDIEYLSMSGDIEYITPYGIRRILLSPQNEIKIKAFNARLYNKVCVHYSYL